MIFTYIVTTWYGSFLISENTVKNFKLFPKVAKEIAKKLLLIDDGKILFEEEELLRNYGKGDVICYDTRLKSICTYEEYERKCFDFISHKKYGYSVGLLQEALVELGKQKLSKPSVIGADKNVIHALTTIESLKEFENILFEKLQDWYELYFPNLRNFVSSEEYLDLVAKYTSREEIKDAKKFSFEPFGVSFTNSEKEVIKEFAKATISIKNIRTKLESYVERKMQEIAPNINYLVGPLLGAKLILLAGGLEKLAKMPSSTIQLLGAEKALFKHLSKGTRCPKHGVLFQHPYVLNSRPQQRGRVTRILAGKIAIAAKADFFTHLFIAEKLKAELESKVRTAQV